MTFTSNFSEFNWNSQNFFKTVHVRDFTKNFTLEIQLNSTCMSNFYGSDCNRYCASDEYHNCSVDGELLCKTDHYPMPEDKAACELNESCNIRCNASCDFCGRLYSEEEIKNPEQSSATILSTTPAPPLSESTNSINEQSSTSSSAAVSIASSTEQQKNESTTSNCTGAACGSNEKGSGENNKVTVAIVVSLCVVVLLCFCWIVLRKYHR